MKILLISGTPGTGKTSVSKKISELINTEKISLNELALSENFTLKYDKKRETQVVDFDKLLPFVIELIQKFKDSSVEFLIIESHFADIIPNEYIDYALILRCNPDELYTRLEKRNYKKEKIIENIQSEILGNCANYFIEKQIKSQILEIDTSNIDIRETANLIIGFLKNDNLINEFKIGKIDWLEDLSNNDRLDEFF